MNRRPNGFSLVELLVVVAIIAVMAAVLAPVFASARDRARQTHCQSNQRQLVMAFNNYATDYDGVLPRGWTPEGGPRKSTLGLRSGQRDWATDTLPYVLNEKLYVCPSKPVLMRGYGVNLWLATKDGFDFSDIMYPTRTAMFAEIQGGAPPRDRYDFVDRSTPEGWPAPEGWPFSSKFHFDPRHNEGANIAFADGSVRHVRSSRYTRWPENASEFLDVTDMSLPAGGTPVGTYWWPTKTSPAGG